MVNGHEQNKAFWQLQRKMNELYMINVNVSPVSNNRNSYSPVLTAASNARKPMAYTIDFFRSNLPGFRIQAVAGWTMKT